LVRAVNTGISAFIDGDGAIREPEVFIDGDKQGRTSPRDPQTGRWLKQLNCVLVATVPLDPRTSWYVRLGDWFAATCALATIVCASSPWFRPTRSATLPEEPSPRPAAVL
jgi:apolipoprotein N-acyltransferase